MEPLGEPEDAAPGVLEALVGPARRTRDILSHDEDHGIALHLLAQCLVDGLDVGEPSDPSLGLCHALLLRGFYGRMI